MELRQLEHFVTVAQERHFTRAAELLQISQSGLSASIRALETELETPLFVRSTRRVELTEAGRALLTESHRTLASVAAAHDAVAARPVWQGLRKASGLGSGTRSRNGCSSRTPRRGLARSCGRPTARQPEDLRRAVQENLENLGLEVLEVVGLRPGNARGPQQGSLAEPFETRAGDTFRIIRLAWSPRRAS